MGGPLVNVWRRCRNDGVGERLCRPVAATSLPGAAGCSHWRESSGRSPDTTASAASALLPVRHDGLVAGLPRVAVYVFVPAAFPRGRSV